jgi:hypothetical protein
MLSDVTPLIAKLQYEIRAIVFTELIQRSNQSTLELLLPYLESESQTAFEFLQETMHLAASLAGDLNRLPNITWLDEKD